MRGVSLIVRRRFGSSVEELMQRRDADSVQMYPPSKVNTYLNITPQGFKMVVERLGRFHSVQEPGLFLAIPLIDRIVAVHDMREMCLQVSKQQATTKDNVRLALEGNVYVRITDVEKATYKIRRPLHAVLRHAEAAMRASVGLFDLDNIFHARAELNAAVLQHLHEACAAWGLEVTRYEVTGVDADAKIAESMDLQAAAERKRRETVKSSMALKESVILESEGQRERDKNESEGQRIRAITEAEGYSQQQILRAQGLKEAKILEAEGIAIALEKIGRATQTESGQRALQFLFGSEYIKYMSALGSKSNSTIFLNQDVGDLSSVLAKGLGLLGSNAFRNNNVHDDKQDTNQPIATEQTPVHSFSQRSVPQPPVDDDVATGQYAKEMEDLRAEMAKFGSFNGSTHRKQ